MKLLDSFENVVNSPTDGSNIFKFHILEVPFPQK